MRRCHAHLPAKSCSSMLTTPCGKTISTSSVQSPALSRFSIITYIRRKRFAKYLISHGYGLHSFSHALLETFERLAVEPLTDALHETIRGFAHTITEHPIEILPKIPETLDHLAARHHIMLVTKGDVTEQSGKVERSGIKQYFAAIEIVPDKNPAAYGQLVAKHKLDPESTWMIGNSPKSDVNPALAAGLNAVFVPHDNTWVLEHEEVAEARYPQKLLVVERFSDLRQHF